MCMLKIRLKGSIQCTGLALVSGYYWRTWTGRNRITEFDVFLSSDSGYSTHEQVIRLKALCHDIRRN